MVRFCAIEIRFKFMLSILTHIRIYSSIYNNDMEKTKANKEFYRTHIEFVYLNCCNCLNLLVLVYELKVDTNILFFWSTRVYFFHQINTIEDTNQYSVNMLQFWIEKVFVLSANRSVACKCKFRHNYDFNEKLWLFCKSRTISICLSSPP